MAEDYRVTSVGVTPAQDRAHRMRLYFIAMSVRMACVASLFFLRGWWILLAAAGAILLPYFAVMIANAVDSNAEARPEQPSPLPIQAASVDRDAPGTTDPSDQLIVLDAPAERRSQSRTRDENLRTATPNEQRTAPSDSSRDAE